MGGEAPEDPVDIGAGARLRPAAGPGGTVPLLAGRQSFEVRNEGRVVSEGMSGTGRCKEAGQAPDLGEERRGTLGTAGRHPLDDLDEDQSETGRDEPRIPIGDFHASLGRGRADLRLDTAHRPAESLGGFRSRLGERAEDAVPSRGRLEESRRRRVEFSGSEGLEAAETSGGGPGGLRPISRRRGLEHPEEGSQGRGAKRPRISGSQPLGAGGMGEGPCERSFRPGPDRVGIAPRIFAGDVDESAGRAEAQIDAARIPRDAGLEETDALPDPPEAFIGVVFESRDVVEQESRLIAPRPIVPRIEGREEREIREEREGPALAIGPVGTEPERVEGQGTEGSGEDRPGEDGKVRPGGGHDAWRSRPRGREAEDHGEGEGRDHDGEADRHGCHGTSLRRRPR